MNTWILIGIGILMLASCKQKTAIQPETAELVQKTADDAYISKKEPDLAYLLTVSYPEAIATYGKPWQESEFNVKDGLGEEQIEIHYYYKEGTDIWLKEAMWQKQDSTVVVIDYHKRNEQWFPFHGWVWE